MVYLIITFIIIALFNVILFSFEYKKERSRRIKNMIFSTFFSFNAVVLFFRIFFNTSVFSIENGIETTFFSLLLLIFSICISTFTFIVRKQIKTMHNLKRSTKRKILILIFKIICFLIFIIGTSILLGISWSIDFYGGLRPEQFFYNIRAKSTGTNSSVFRSMLHTPILITVCLSVLFYLLLFFKMPITTRLNAKTILRWNHIRTILLSSLSVPILILGVHYSVQTEYLNAAYNAFLTSSDYIHSKYTNPKSTNLKFPEKKRNLIHIYAESFENSFSSKEFGGYMDENLIPQLTELAQTNVHFSHNDKMGGWYQTYGSSWSIAGIVNMESGIPLKLSIDGNTYGKEGNFLPGVTNLGDVLNQEGYNQMVMLGSESEFAGRDVYFKQHGNYSIFDVNEARKRQLIPENYNEWWGFEDDKLYEFAKPEIMRLAEMGEPFHFNMITADTHFPDGYVSKQMERKRNSQYADVIAYSDAQIGSFVKWIQSQPFYENTTIVITGDHLSMDKTFFQDFSPEYVRTPFNVFINVPQNTENIKKTNRQFSVFDIFPTMVAALDVEIENNRLGLGVNLFSDQQTLVEKDGLAYVNEELGKHSSFYDVMFIEKRRNN